MVYKKMRLTGFDKRMGILMRTKLAVMFVGAGLFLAIVPAWAHHSVAAEDDGTKPITLQGKVTKMDWVNPHVWIHLEVKNQDGSVTGWMVEGGSPNALLRRGFTRDSLPLGTELVVKAFLAKDGTHLANGKQLTLTDGKKLFLGSSGEGAPPAEK